MSTPSQPVPRRLRRWLIPLCGMALVVLAAVAVVVVHDVRAGNRAAQAARARLADTRYRMIRNVCGAVDVDPAKRYSAEIEAGTDGFELDHTEVQCKVVSGLTDVGSGIYSTVVIEAVIDVKASVSEATRDYKVDMRLGHSGVRSLPDVASRAY